jgi:1,4-alpha-glucan branching enzyme
MFEMGRKKGTVKFVLPANGGTHKVQLAGDFSAWQPVVMRKQKDGSYMATVELGPGTYEYKFLLDGEWVVDPDNNAWALNPFGTVNSVAQVQ